MYGENEENYIKEKIPFTHVSTDAGNDDFIKEGVESAKNSEIKATSEKIEGIIEWNKIVNLYRNASPSERIKVENEISSFYGNAAADIINYLRVEAQNYDLANTIKEKIDKKLK